MADEESAPPPPAEDAPPAEAPAEAAPKEAPAETAPKEASAEAASKEAPAEAAPKEAPAEGAPAEAAPEEAPSAEAALKKSASTEAPAKAPPPEAPPAEAGLEAKPTKSTSFQGAKEPSRSLSGVRAERSDSKRISEEAIMRRRSDRPSKARIALGSVISLKRGSVTGEYFDKAKAPRYANSYKLESDKPFHIEKVEKILQTVLVETMEDMTYDPDKCAKQAKYACSAIRAKVKEQEFDRYKLVIMVTFGEKMCQDVLATCRFLWDCERDKYALFSHENAQVFGIALCFGIYYE